MDFLDVVDAKDHGEYGISRREVDFYLNHTLSDLIDDGSCTEEE